MVAPACREIDGEGGQCSVGGADPAYRAAHAALTSLTVDLAARWRDHNVAVRIRSSETGDVMSAFP